MRILLSSLILFSLFVGFSFPTKALTFDDLPTGLSSNQWSVTVEEAKTGKESIKSQKGVHNNYSFKVRNIGKEVNLATVQAFRNEPNTKTQYGLFDPITNAGVAKVGQEFNFNNFGLAEKATELKIVVTWKEKESNRELQEEFLFKE